MVVGCRGLVMYLQQYTDQSLDLQGFTVTKTIILVFKEKTCKPLDKTLLELKNPVVVNKLFRGE